MNRAPLEIGWEISDDHILVDLWIEYQGKRSWDFHSSLGLEEFKASNGWRIRSLHQPEVNQLEKIFYLCGDQFDKDHEVLSCRYEVFLKVLQAVHELNQYFLNDLRRPTLEEEFFQRTCTNFL